MKKPKLAYIIEDDPITAVITELIIRRDLLCQQVQQFVNGQQALDHLTAALETPGADSPDLILLDLNMPLMDGWEFLDAFARLAIAKNVCVFVLTSSIHPDDIAKSKVYPEVKGYFSKPLDIINVGRMRKLLETAQLEAAPQAARTL